MHQWKEQGTFCVDVKDKRLGGQTDPGNRSYAAQPARGSGNGEKLGFEKILRRTGNPKRLGN